MEHHQGNYDALRALHEARLQSVRASAVAAGHTSRRRRRTSLLDRVRGLRSAGRVLGSERQPEPRPEHVFWG